MRVDFMSGSFKAQISSRGFNDGIISKLYSNRVVILPPLFIHLYSTQHIIFKLIPITLTWPKNCFCHSVCN